jgi:hypothetical protein
MEKARILLKFYFKYLFTKTGLEWTSDNDAEIDDIIEDISEEIEAKRGTKREKDTRSRDADEE